MISINAFNQRLIKSLAERAYVSEDDVIDVMMCCLLESARKADMSTSDYIKKELGIDDCYIALFTKEEN